MAIRKNEAKTLPRMGGTYANTVSVKGGNFPIRRNVNRLRAIFNKRVIVDFARMKRHVQVEVIALQGWRGVSSSMCVCTSAQQKAYKHNAGGDSLIQRFLGLRSLPSHVSALHRKNAEYVSI